MLCRSQQLCIAQVICKAADAIVDSWQLCSAIMRSVSLWLTRAALRRRQRVWLCRRQRHSAAVSSSALHCSAQVNLQGCICFCYDASLWLTRAAFAPSAACLAMLWVASLCRSQQLCFALLKSISARLHAIMAQSTTVLCYDALCVTLPHSRCFCAIGSVFLGSASHCHTRCRMGSYVRVLWYAVLCIALLPKALPPAALPPGR